MMLQLAERSRTSDVAMALICAGVLAGCSKEPSEPAPSPPTTAGTGGHPAGAMGAAGKAGSLAAGNAGKSATGVAGGGAGGAGTSGSSGASGTMATGIAGMIGAGAGQGGSGEPPELPLEITNMDVAKNVKRRYGAPHVAVNPKDPNNIVVLASSDMGYTRDCVPAPPGSDCEMIGAGPMFFLTQPRGFYKTPGFMDIGVFVSFDRGKSFKQIDISALVPPDHPEVRARGEGPIGVTSDGTFYIGFNAINWGQWETPPTTFFPNGGVGLIKSTDGGMTWTWQSFTGTPADWPYGCVDPVTGTFYSSSGIGGLTTLGTRSTGNPDSPEGSIADRWISSTQDGVTWTEPQPFGGSSGASHVSANGNSVAAAHGILGTAFVASDSASCSFFVDSASSSCVVFQTSTDAGKTWSRHRVPTPSGFSPAALSMLVAADPSKKGHFVVTLLNDSGADLRVFSTPDSGATWADVKKVTNDDQKTYFAPWVAYSPKGTFGVMWRRYEREGAKLGASPPYMPYSVWAVLSNDGGTTFSQPLKVSKANSPSPPDDPDDAFSFVGDHGPSGMALDDSDGAYVVWADWTPGERAIFFSAINVKAFQF